MSDAECDALVAAENARIVEAEAAGWRSWNDHPGYTIQHLNDMLKPFGLKMETRESPAGPGDRDPWVRLTADPVSVIGSEHMTGVLYRADDRHGPTRQEYTEAIADLAAARDEEPGGYCGVCSDSGHTANQCHHNPLVMARRAVTASRVWRCYHCNAVFTGHEAAEAHFGRRDDEVAKCIQAEAGARANGEKSDG